MTKDAENNVPSIGGDRAPKIRRVNKLPIYITITLTVIAGIFVIYGLATRGFVHEPDARDRECAVSK